LSTRTLYAGYFQASPNVVLFSERPGERRRFGEQYTALPNV